MNHSPLTTLANDLDGKKVPAEGKDQLNSKTKVLLSMVFLGITSVYLIFKSYYPEISTCTYEVVNTTNQQIKSIRFARAVQFGTDDLIVYGIDGIGPGEAKSLEITGPSDVFYTVSVYFSDGSKVEGDAGYAESNRRVKVIIGEKKVTSQRVGKQ